MEKKIIKKEEATLAATNPNRSLCSESRLRNTRRRAKDQLEASSSTNSEPTEATVILSGEGESVQKIIMDSNEEEPVQKIIMDSNEDESVEVTVSESNEEVSEEDTLNESDIEIYYEIVEDIRNINPSFFQKEFGLLQEFKSCIKQIKARVEVDQMPKNNLISALDILENIFVFLSIKGPGVNTNFHILYEHFKNLKEALNISNTFPSVDISENVEITNTEPVTGLKKSSILNTPDEEYNPSSRMPLEKTGIFIPFSRFRAVRDHYCFISSSLETIKRTLENCNSIEDNVLQLKKLMLLTGMYVMEDFVDFVKFLSGKVTTQLERSESPTNPFSQKEIRLAFVHLDFVPILARKKDLLQTCRCHISELSNQFPEKENSEVIGDQSTEYSDKSISDNFLSLLEMQTSPTDFSEYSADHIDDLMSELCKYNYMVEGLTFSCMDAMRAILELCCKVDNRCSPSAMRIFLNNTLQVFSQLVSMRESYCEFIENIDDMPVEIILGSKVMFAKKFTKLLQIDFNVSINFWTHHLNRLI